MADYQYWVHGSDVNIWSRENTIRIQRGGAYTLVQQESGTSNTFFFAIPTPTEISDNRSIEVEEVYLHARLDDAELESVTVHEGTTQIFTEILDGTHTQGEDMILTFDLKDKVVQSAINFGVSIDFLETSDIEGVPAVRLIAAGARFDTFGIPLPPDADEKVVKETFFFRPGRSD